LLGELVSADALSSRIDEIFEATSWKCMPLALSDLLKQREAFNIGTPGKPFAKN
jgi:hypothetical protein